VLSVQRSRGLAEVPKMEKSPIVKEETGGRRSRGSGEGTSEGLWEKTRIFVKSRRAISNPGHWIWKDTWQRISASLIHNQKKQSREETGLAKSELTIRSQSLIARRTRTVDLVPKHSSIQKIGKEEEATRESPEVWGHEGSWPTVIVHGHINEEVSIES
jgi:hypothetical protein